MFTGAEEVSRSGRGYLKVSVADQSCVAVRMDFLPFFAYIMPVEGKPGIVDSCVRSSEDFLQEKSCCVCERSGGEYAHLRCYVCERSGLCGYRSECAMSSFIYYSPHCIDFFTNSIGANHVVNRPTSKLISSYEHINSSAGTKKKNRTGSCPKVPQHRPKVSQHPKVFSNSVAVQTASTT